MNEHAKEQQMSTLEGKNSNRKRQTGNGPRERATVGTGAGNGPQKEWDPFIVADYGGLSPLPGSSNWAGLLVTCLLNLEFTKMEGLC